MDMHKVTIFDADFLLFSATMGKKCLDDEGNPIKEDNKFVYIPRTLEEVFECADNIITNMLDITQSSKYVGYLGGCRSFRYTIYSDYKGNRINKERPPFFQELKDYLVNKWKFILTDNGLEADDTVNIVRNNLQNDFDCTIVSSDKDLIKSIKGSYLNARTLELIETTEEEAKKFFWTSMICGDTTDNIKGIPGRGQKYADTVFSGDNCLYFDNVLWAYMKYYGEADGIDEFYKNYKCLHILDKFSNFVNPELSEWDLFRGYSVKEELEGI